MLIPRARFRKLCDVRDRLVSGEGSVRELAEVAGLSRFHFIRVFDALFGSTPHQLRIRARFDRARDLLARKELSITEICFEVGAASLGTFSDQFRRHVGLAPSDYRRSARSVPEVPGCLGLMTQLPETAFAISEKRDGAPSQ
jgi:AraC-like DNA-binding protein